jgi:penicillin-binding protein 1A
MRVPAPIRRSVLVLLGLVVLGVPSLVTVWVSAPDTTDIQQRVKAITDARGVPLLRPDEVPPMLAEAIVAMEDERFYEHHGVDSIGLGRAVLYDFVNVCLCQGGSTITAQLVKDVYLNGSDHGGKKVVDMILALKVERVIGKKQILADYLSEILTGFGTYGMTDAACRYFAAPLSKLTLAQYALLGGVPQAPSLYDPTVNPNAAMQRRSEVLDQMVSLGEITPAQARAANAEPVLGNGPGC